MVYKNEEFSWILSRIMEDVVQLDHEVYSYYSVCYSLHFLIQVHYQKYDLIYKASISSCEKLNRFLPRNVVLINVKIVACNHRERANT